MNSSDFVRVKPASVTSALLLGIKYGFLAIAMTLIASPLLGEIQDLIYRFSYQLSIPSIFPPAWACGIFTAISLFLLLPYLTAGSILSLYYRQSQNKLSNYVIEGQKLGSLIGFVASLIGSFFSELQTRSNMWSIWITLLIWGTVVFAWIGKRIQFIYQTQNN